jgi:type VI secretion system protein VasG
MKVKKVAKRLWDAHRMTLKVDETVYGQMASMCQQVDIGARQIDHLLDRAVLPELSRQLLAKMTEDTMPTSVTMTTNEAGEFSYDFES